MDDLLAFEGMVSGDKHTTTEIDSHRRVVSVREGIGVLLFFILCLAIVYWPLVTGRGVFAVDWSLLFHYPAFAAMERSVRLYHELPLWETSYFSGFPFFAGNSLGVLQPLSLVLLRFINFIDAYHYATLVALLAALFSMYLFARQQALSRPGAIIAALTYGFSQYVVTWSHGNVWSQSFFCPPLFLYLIGRISERTCSWRYTIGACAAVAIALWSSLTDIVCYTLLVGCFYAVYLDLRDSHNGRSFYVSARLLLLTVVGGLLAAPLILPTLRIVAFSYRAGGFSFWGSGGEAGLAIGDLPLLLYPQFYPYIPYFNAAPWIYVGTFSLLLGLWGMVRHREQRNGTFLFWVVVGLFIAALPYSPLYWLIQHIPPFNMLHQNFKLLPLLIVIFSIFAGFGFDLLQQDFRKRSFRIYVAVWQVIAGSTITGVAIFTSIWHLRLLPRMEAFIVNLLLRRPNPKPAEQYRAVLHNIIDQLRDNLSLSKYAFVAALLFLISAVCVVTIWTRQKAPREFLRRITFALTVLNFLVIWQGGGRFFPRAIISTPPTFESIRFDDGQPFRIASAIPDSALVRANHLRPAEELKRIQLVYALGMRLSPAIFNLESIGGNDPLYPERYQHTVATFGPTDVLEDPPEFASLSFEQKSAYTAARTNLYSMMNVRYLITPYELPLPWTKIDRRTVNDVQLSLYENGAVLPRAYFARHITMTNQNATKNFALLLENPDFSQNTFIECRDTSCPAQGLIEGSDTANVSIYLNSPRSFTVRTHADQNRRLVVSNSNLPYWQVRIDASPSPIYTANYLYQGVYVPSGDHTIEFSYPGIMRQTQLALIDLLGRKRPYTPYLVK